MMLALRMVLGMLVLGFLPFGLLHGAELILSEQEVQAFDRSLQNPDRFAGDYLALDSGQYVRIGDLLALKLKLPRSVDLIRDPDELRTLSFSLSHRDVVYLSVGTATTLTEAHLKKVADFCQSRGRTFYHVQIQSRPSQVDQLRALSTGSI